MNKIEYFKKAIKSELFKKKAWIISAFTVTNEGPEDYKKDSYNYRLVRSGNLMQFLDAGDLVKIDDYIPGEPLFAFKDEFVVDNDLCINVTEPIVTTYGNVLFNCISITRSFGNKIPFITGRVSINSIENIIASKLESVPDKGTERKQEFIYVDEYIKFVDSLEFLKGLSFISVVTTTEKSITSPPGLEEFKQSLMKKYGDKLQDPVYLSNFEKELQAFDEEYLKDDPSNGIFLSGKTKDLSRKKTKLVIGGDAGFTSGLKLTPVTNSLEQGWPTEPKEIVSMMNTLRFGSYARGNETEKGGVTGKVLTRAGNNFKILEEDCNTTLGITKVIYPHLAYKLVGRYIMKNNTWVLVKDKDEANTYIGKIIMIRSPMYCKHLGDRICRYCAGERLALNANGILTALLEVSNIIVTASMKQMHGAVLSTQELNINEILS